MKNTPVLVAMAALLFTAAGTALAAPEWRYVRNIGTWQFVVVEPTASANAEILLRAARAICTPTKACMVVFWSDAAAVPTSMPMTRAQQKAVIARYMHNPTGVSEELQLRCREDAPAAAKCLR